MADEIKKDYELPGQYHHYLGIEMNIQTWNLLGKKERTKQDNQRMIAFAFASQYHWYKSPKWKPENAQRGEWLISRVYSVLGSEEKALGHAKKCLDMTEKLGLKNFNKAYAYEAMARAYAISGDKKSKDKYYELAQKAGEEIANKEDRKYFFKDLESSPWEKAKD